MTLFPNRLPSPAPILLWAGALTVAVPNPAAAQETLQLGPPLAAAPEPMSFVQTVREMPDGRILVADPLEQALYFLDLETGTRRDIGREGGGPEEFRQPDSVWPWPGGGSLMVDLGNARLVELGPDGAFGETHPLILGEPGPGQAFTLVLPRGVDEEGGVYLTQRGMFQPGQPFPDSSFVVRADLGTATVDTLLQVKTEDMEVQEMGGGNVSVRSIPLSSADAWGVAPDGRVVVARSGEYRVEWHHPDGTVVRGSPIPFRAPRIGNGEKRAWFRESSGAGISLEIMRSNTDTRMTVSRGGSASSDEPDLDRYDWPDRLSPVVDDPILVDGRGRAWVRRSVAADQPVTYDLFDGQANRVATVVLPEGRRIIAFGDGAVYTTRRDEFDLVYLEKYGLP